MKFKLVVDFEDGRALYEIPIPLRGLVADDFAVARFKDAMAVARSEQVNYDQASM